MKNIVKNKAVLFGLGTVVIVIIMAIFGGQEARNNPKTISTSPLPSSTSQFAFSNLNEDKKAQAQEYRRLIADRLPIRTSYKTSVGIETSINIYIAQGDPIESTRFEVFGLSYINPESNPSKNPNSIAYADSYREGIKLLKAKGIDPSQLVFTYNDQNYIKTTIAKWIAAFKLVP